MRALCFAAVVSIFFLSSFFSLYILSGCRLDVYHTWCGLSANLECMSEMCCMRLAEIQDAKNSPKIRHLRSIAQICRAISLQWRHILTIGKKLVKPKYIQHMSSQNDKLRPTNGWHRLAGLWHPSKFQHVSRIGFVTAPTSLNWGQPNFARCLAVYWAGTLYIHFWGLLPPNGILPGAKFTLHPSLAFSYIGSITARHSRSGHQPNFMVWYLHATGWPSHSTVCGWTV